MAVGKGSIKRAAKAVDSSTAAAPAKKPAVKRTTVKKETVKETNTIGIGTELPTYLL